MEDRIMDEATEIELSPKEKTLELIDLRIRGVQAQVDRMNEVIDRCYDTGGHVISVVDEEKAAAEIKRLKSARRRVVKDLDPLPKYDWKQKQSVTFKMPTPVLNRFIHSG